MSRPAAIPPVFYERVWGSQHLEPWFPNADRKIGEVWFAEPDSPVLVKFLFATENLSVQVHPDDELARAQGHARGKTEMWHILRAEPGARIAMGFRGPEFGNAVTPEQVRQSAADGSIMDALRWVPAVAGQTWYIPAGVVHAIGAGVTLLEIQQNSDVTYRLFDYGRGRELHLEQSLRAMNAELRPEPAVSAGRQAAAATPLVKSPFFETSVLAVSGDRSAVAQDLAIVTEGSGTLNGEEFRLGQVFHTKQGTEIRLTGEAQLFLVATRI